MPHIVFFVYGATVVLIQPSSTVLVDLLGIATVAFGVRFLRTKRGQASREFWGAGRLSITRDSWRCTPRTSC